MKQKKTSYSIATLTCASLGLLGGCLFSENDSTLGTETPLAKNDTLSTLAQDANTLRLVEFDATDSTEAVEGVQGKGLLLKPGQHLQLDTFLVDTIPAGVLEFWFRPSSDFYDAPRTLLGTDGARLHFFYKDGALYFQKNLSNDHHFVSASITLPDEWSLISGQWGDGYISIYINGQLAARKADTTGYQPSPRGSQENNLQIGYKSSCCMEGPGLKQELFTSGAFDQLRLSNRIRYRALQDTTPYTPDTATDSISSQPESTVVIPPVVNVDTMKAASLLWRPGQDSTDEAQIYVSTGYLGEINSGKSVCLTAAAYDASTIMRSLFRFTLPNDLQASSIKKASLKLHTQKWMSKHSNKDLKLDLHEVLRPWNEGTGASTSCTVTSNVTNSAKVNGVTGLESSYGVAWNQAGLGLDGIDAVKQAANTQIMVNGADSVAFDVTSLVRQWIENPASNHGVLLRNQYENDGSYPAIPLFVSSEDTTKSEQWPALYLEFN